MWGSYTHRVAEPTLVCTVEHGDPTRVVVVGEIDVSTAPILTEALGRALAGGTAVEVDMSAVGFMDSTGLNALIASRADTVHDLVIVDASREVRRLLVMTGLATVFGLPTDSLEG